MPEGDLGTKTRVPFAWVVAITSIFITILTAILGTTFTLYVKNQMKESSDAAVDASKANTKAVSDQLKENSDALSARLEDLKKTVEKNSESMEAIRENTLKTAMQAQSASVSLAAMQSAMPSYATREYIDGLRQKADVEHLTFRDADARHDAADKRHDDAIEQLKKDVADLKSRGSGGNEKRPR